MHSLLMDMADYFYFHPPLQRLKGSSVFLSAFANGATQNALSLCFENAPFIG